MTDKYNLDELWRFIEGNGTVKCESAEELYELVSTLRSIGFKIGFNPEEYEDFRYIALGTIYQDQIHAARDSSMHPNDELRTLSSFLIDHVHGEKEFVTLDINELLLAVSNQ